MLSCSVSLRMAIKCGRGRSGSFLVREVSAWSFCLIVALVVVVVGKLMVGSVIVIEGIVNFMS